MIYPEGKKIQNPKNTFTPADFFFKKNQYYSNKLDLIKLTILKFFNYIFFT